jgi:flavin reductase (DIM6/NTAB) family NADH-FMN oxidoreductase RutF
VQSFHVIGEPSILYFGTPVILISTVNADGTVNLAPMSSGWWLGWRCMLGLGNVSKTPQNMMRTGECVLNLPSILEVGAVNRLARLTGTKDVPDIKKAMGYTYETRKFEAAGLTPIPSQTGGPPRVLECPVQLEAVVSGKHDMMQDAPNVGGFFSAFEVRITRVHLHPDIR